MPVPDLERTCHGLSHFPSVGMVRPERPHTYRRHQSAAIQFPERDSGWVYRHVSFIAYEPKRGRVNVY